MNRNVDTVVKLGGGMLAHAEHFAAALATVAAAGRARRLLLVQPPGVHLDRTAPTGHSGAAAVGRPSDGMLDPYFDRALPHHVRPVVVPADQLETLRAVLRASIDDEIANRR